MRLRPFARPNNRGSRRGGTRHGPQPSTRGRLNGENGTIILPWSGSKCRKSAELGNVRRERREHSRGHISTVARAPPSPSLPTAAPSLSLSASCCPSPLSLLGELLDVHVDPCLEGAPVHKGAVGLAHGRHGWRVIARALSCRAQQQQQQQSRCRGRGGAVESVSVVDLCRRFSARCVAESQLPPHRPRGTT